MKSSDERGGFLSNGPIYSLLALYMPLSVLTALVFLSQMFLPFSPVPLLSSGIFGALIASFYCDFMKDTKSSRTAANIRALVIVLCISYIFSSLFRSEIYWKERLIPDLSTIFAFVGTFYVWSSVIALKQLFTDRKLFEAYTELYRGEQLHEALYEEQYLLECLDTEIVKAKKSYLISLLLIGIIFIFNTAYKIHLSLLLYVLVIGVLAGGICIFGFFGIIRKEHYCAAQGMTLSPADKARHILWVGIFSALSVVAAILLSSDKSLLPVSLIIGLFNWFLVLFRWFLRLIIVSWGSFDSGSEVIPETMILEPFPFPLEQIEERDPLPIGTWLKYGFIILAAAGFIWFMISPLLNRVKSLSGELTFFQKLRRIIAEWFNGALTGLASFFTFIKSGGTMRKLRRKPDAETVRQTAGAVLGAYAQARKRAVRQSATLFARIIIWGGEVRQVLWKPVHAPGEYCRLLVEVSPGEEQLNGGILRCGELFEKALYSAEILSDAERKEFKSLVEEITSVL